MGTQAIKSVDVELSIVLGQKTMSVQQILRMGRGAVIALDAYMDSPVDLYANQTLVARGELVIEGEQIQVKVIEKLN